MNYDEWVRLRLTFDDWLAIGRANGYCGPAVCDTHDGTPTTAAEDDEFDDGGDPCVGIVRLYADIGAREAVEANHSPSVWRRTNSERTT